MLKERNCCLKNTSEIVKNLFEQILPKAEKLWIYRAVM
jgi:hypothetical protein